jgi:hypothetical protein
VLLCGASAVTVKGQQWVKVDGLAFDSTRSKPLNGATVQLGGSRSVVTDSNGRFAFDSVAPGTYRIVMFHDRLDSIGLPGIVSQVRVSDQDHFAVLAIPSFRTFWHATCGPQPPTDTGFVYGRLRRTDGQQPDSAQITAQWGEITYEKTTGFSRRQWQARVESQANGTYSLCGIPAETPIRLVANGPGLAESFRDIVLDSGLIQRRDFLLAPVGSALSAIRGVVYDGESAPRQGARVSIDSFVADTTDERGEFFIPNVHPGTRNIRVLAVGAEPSDVAVDVLPGDTSRLSMRLTQLTVLAPVDIKAPASVRDRWAQQMSQRQAKGIGIFVDSLALLRYPSPIKALSMLTQIGHVCAIFVDGIQLIDRPRGQALRDFEARSAQDFAVIEVQKGPQIPMEFRGRCQVSSTSLVVLAWTKLGR